jgi:transmembrane sensor
VGRGTPRLDQPRIDAVTAWRRGEVMLDNTTLADAVAEMNRYDERLLIIDDPSAAAMRVSGIYHAGDSAGFARTVAALYGLQVVHEPGRIHLRGAVSHDAGRLLHQ